jgi:hypothetical protein
VSDTDAEQRAAADRGLLRRVQLTVMGLLALCALIIVLAAEASDLGYTDRRFTLGALMLGGGSILARGRALAARDSRTRVGLAAAAMLLAGGIGVLGAVLAVSQDERDAGLLFALGGALLALRGSAGARAVAPPRGSP